MVLKLILKRPKKSQLFKIIHESDSETQLIWVPILCLVSRFSCIYRLWATSLIGGPTWRVRRLLGPNVIAIRLVYISCDSTIHKNILTYRFAFAG